MLIHGREKIGTGVFNPNLRGKYINLAHIMAKTIISKPAAGADVFFLNTRFLGGFFRVGNQCQNLHFWAKIHFWSAKAAKLAAGADAFLKNTRSLYN